MPRGGWRPGAGRKPNPVVEAVKAVGAALGFPREGLRAASARARGRVHHVSPFKFPDFPAEAIPPGGGGLAQDAALKKLNEWAGAQDQQIIQADPFSFGPGGQMLAGLGGPFQGMGFLGYTFLAELMQRAEYQGAVQIMAEEMTRKWIKVKSASNDIGKEEQVKAVTKFMEGLELRDRFRLAAVHDGEFGRCHLYIETGSGNTWEDREELIQPIGDGGDKVSRAKVSRETPIRRVVNVEPVWAYPTNYNSSNPIAPDWYKPTQWFVMARPMHATRLLTLVGRPVPDLLKPAYAFGGLSMVQLGVPYVTRWLRTVANVNDLINNFSVVGLKTDLQTSLQGDGQQLFERVELFNRFRDNGGLMLVQQGAQGQGEEFWNVAVPLGTLDKLQAQAQEHMAAVWHIPLVKLLGISPAGLNATAEPEIRVFYDHVHAYQEVLFRAPLTTIFRFCQLSVLGEVDEDLTFDFEPLWALDEKSEAELRKTEMETDTGFIDAGVLHPEEVRERIANDPDTPYEGINVADVPDLLEEEEEGLEPKGGRPQPVAQEEAEGEEGAGDDRVVPFAGDEAPPDIDGVSGNWEPHEAALTRALDLDRLGYLRGLRRLSFLPGDPDRWNSDYDAELDQITVEGKFAAKDDEDKVRTFLHEAGHRGALKVDKRTYADFLKRGLGDAGEFMATANPVHAAAFAEGFEEDVPGEVFAESYARHLLGLRQPPELDAFWEHRFAQDKYTHAEVNYRKGTLKRRCGLCTMFCGADDCTAVEAPIEPTGVCNIFKLSGYAHDAASHAAGVAFVTPSNKALFLRWAPSHARAGEWGFPGGGLEDGEQPEDAARREATEETGWGLSDDHYLPLLARNGDRNLVYWTFKHPTANEFQPRLSDEHDAYEWRDLADPPQPLHPGVTHVLRSTGLGQDEWRESDHPRGQPGNAGQSSSDQAAVAGGPRAKPRSPTIWRCNR